MANKKRYAFISVEERNGEREYSHYVVEEIPEGLELDDMITQACKDMVGYEPEENEVKEAEKREDDGDDFYSPSLEYCASPGVGSKEITEEEFNVLKRFI